MAPRTDRSIPPPSCRSVPPTLHAHRACAPRPLRARRQQLRFREKGRRRRARQRRACLLSSARTRARPLQRRCATTSASARPLTLSAARCLLFAPRRAGTDGEPGPTCWRGTSSAMMAQGGLRDGGNRRMEGMASPFIAHTTRHFQQGRGRLNSGYRGYVRAKAGGASRSARASYTAEIGTPNSVTRELTSFSQGARPNSSK